MENLIVSNRLACLALHLSGASLTKRFRYYQKCNYTDTGVSLYDKKFYDLMENAYLVLQQHSSRNISVIAIIDREYPDLLKGALNPPLCLFFSGNLSLLKIPRISIVGTRNPSVFTSLWIKNISKFLSSNGFILVSGLANGIDSIVHANALDHGTIGIIPHSLDIWSPAKNKYLFRMAQENKKVLLFSEYPITTETRKFHFVHRNRIIAGISSQTILAEAGTESGALITANYALHNHRIVHVLNHEFQKNNDGGKLLLKKNLAKSLSENFPVHVFNRDSFNHSDFHKMNEVYYLGNEVIIYFNERDFSIKSLQPALPDQDFEPYSG